jgi:DNA-binding MarR family transcriptional regulator
VTDEQDIRAALEEAGKNRGEISRLAKALGIAPSTVTRWIAGGEIPPPMLKLLNLYFFDKMPFDITGESILNSMLDFTEDQWKVICVLAGRQGISPGTWIANQIRAYLAWDDEAKAERAKLEAARRASNAGLEHLQELQKVADDPAHYGRDKKNGTDLGNG